MPPQFLFLLVGRKSGAFLKYIYLLNNFKLFWESFNARTRNDKIKTSKSEKTNQNYLQVNPHLEKGRTCLSQI